MDVSETLKKAWTAVEDAGLPEKIQEVAFREAVRILVPASTAQVKEPPAAKPSGNGGSGAGPSDGTTGSDVSEGEIYDRVVAATGADRDKLEQIFHLNDDGLRLSLPGIKLGKTNAVRARTVAHIITIARGFGLEEAETSLEVIRTECERLKVYDSANFSSHMKGLSGFVINGSGQNRRLRAKGPGIVAFPALVDGLLGDM